MAVPDKQNELVHRRIAQLEERAEADRLEYMDKLKTIPLGKLGTEEYIAAHAELDRIAGRRGKALSELRTLRASLEAKPSRPKGEKKPAPRRGSGMHERPKGGPNEDND